MKAKPSCVLLSSADPEMHACAESHARQYFEVLRVLTKSDEKKWREPDLEKLNPDYVFSFISNHILRGELLLKPNVNFHPGPPEWPGVGGASLALFHGDTSYGATAHIMTKIVDAGEIIRVKRFPILANEGCESIYFRSEQACLELFYEILGEIVRHGAVPAPTGDKWKGKAVRKREFEEWLVLNPENPEEFHRKIAAARHTRKPGPYVIIHGVRFGYIRHEPAL